MLKANLKTKEEVINLVNRINEVKPKNVAIDTETTGLNITKDKAFLISLAFEADNKIEAYNILPEVIGHTDLVFKAISACDKVIGHNIKFDLHMLRNTGFEYTTENLSDTLILGRLALDVDTKSLRLKYLAKTYIDSESANDELIISALKKSIKREKSKPLNALLKPHKLTLMKLEKLIKDPLIGFEGLDSEVKELYKTWAKENNHLNYYEPYEPNYYEIYRAYPEQMLKYAANDVIITLQIYNKFIDTVKNSGQERVLRNEENILMPLYTQEKNGIAIDSNYLENSILKVREAIKRNRNRLAELAGEPLTAGQHKRIKELFFERFFTVLEKTDEPTLSSLNTKNEGAMSFAKTIVMLRTLEKWYTTYLLQYKRQNENSKIHPTYSHTGPITGRLSSNVHQFPKVGITDEHGQELFNPRKLIVPSKNGYNNILYFDFSQMELRILADYTIKTAGGDKNLCRAYIPFETDPETWVPTDLHTETAKIAFEEEYKEAIKRTDDVNEDKIFKPLRFAAKTANFSIIYGAGPKGLSVQNKLKPLGLEGCKKLYNAFREAFPGAIKFMQHVQDNVAKNGYIKNAYGRRYLASDFSQPYKFSNYIIQGTGADMLKESMYNIYKYLRDKKSRILTSIHDEIQIELFEGEEYILPEIKKLMEAQTFSEIPILSDIEITSTNWAEKKLYKEAK